LSHRGSAGIFAVCDREERRMVGSSRERPEPERNEVWGDYAASHGASIDVDDGAILQPGSSWPAADVIVFSGADRLASGQRKGAAVATACE
jgi:hypothetical protein